MNFRKVDNTYILKLEKEQEIISVIKEFCKQNDIEAGTISGIGVAKDVQLGYFDAKKKAYKTKTLKGDYEITSMFGNISYYNNDLVIHLHINLADKRFVACGGHLLEGKIGLTGEIFIQALNTRIDRIRDADLGLNVFNL